MVFCAVRIARAQSTGVIFKLNEEARRTNLREPLQEITLMLEQNLLHKFRLQRGVAHAIRVPPSRMVGNSVKRSEG